MPFQCPLPVELVNAGLLFYKFPWQGGFQWLEASGRNGRSLGQGQCELPLAMKTLYSQWHPVEFHAGLMTGPRTRK